jgi:hypothetical protein
MVLIQQKKLMLNYSLTTLIQLEVASFYSQSKLPLSFYLIISDSLTVSYI